MGYFNLDNHLSFNLTDLRSNTTTYIRAVDETWAFHKEAPSVLLKGSDGAQVIRTGVTMRGDCTQFKVCAAQDNGVGITVPVGLILARQMDYAMSCTAPHNVSVSFSVSVGPFEVSVNDP